jgi:hypothetical protein
LGEAVESPAGEAAVRKKPCTRAHTRNHIHTYTQTHVHTYTQVDTGASASCGGRLSVTVASRDRRRWRFEGWGWWCRRGEGWGPHQLLGRGHVDLRAQRLHAGLGRLT